MASVALVSIGGFVIGDSALEPDLFVVDRRRAEQMDAYRGASRGCPDLAVEIVSPSEGADDVQEKAITYLAAGVKTVWTVFPKSRTVLVRHAGGITRTAGIDDQVDALEVLPGWSLAVATIFG